MTHLAIGSGSMIYHFSIGSGFVILRKEASDTEMIPVLPSKLQPLPNRVSRVSKPRVLLRLNLAPRPASPSGFVDVGVSVTWSKRALVTERLRKSPLPKFSFVEMVLDERQTPPLKPPLGVEFDVVCRCGRPPHVLWLLLLLRAVDVEVFPPLLVELQNMVSVNVFSLNYLIYLR